MIIKLYKNSLRTNNLNQYQVTYFIIFQINDKKIRIYIYKKIIYLITYNLYHKIQINTIFIINTTNKIKNHFNSIIEIIIIKHKIINKFISNFLIKFLKYYHSNKYHPYIFRININIKSFIQKILKKFLIYNKLKEKHFKNKTKPIFKNLKYNNKIKS